ncbi:aminopeptidase [Patescibacteria group bacterium]
MSKKLSKLDQAAKTVVTKIVGIKPGEKVFILTNPGRELEQISFAIANASHNVGAHASLVFQDPKEATDFMEPQVLETFNTKPDVYIGINEYSTGADPEGQKNPYPGKQDLAKRDIRFYLLENGMRGFWYQRSGVADFIKFVDTDASDIQALAKKIVRKLTLAKKAIVKTGKDAELTLDITKHKPHLDDGDLTKPGRHGNIPFGEAMVSPTVGKANGTIMIDGLIMTTKGINYVHDPVKVHIKDGKAYRFDGKREADLMKKDFRNIKKMINGFSRAGKITGSDAQLMISNITAIGEFGIGLNKKAKLTKKTGPAEAEKVYGSIHIAFGIDYDGDIKALNHLDDVVRSPEVWLIFPGGKRELILKDNQFFV